MNPLDEAVLEVCQFLEQHRIRYGLMGGYALQRWREPRAPATSRLRWGIKESEKKMLLHIGAGSRTRLCLSESIFCRRTHRCVRNPPSGQRKTG